MSQTHTRPRGAVVVGVEGDEPDERSLVAAIAEARWHHRPLHLLHATAIGIVPWTPERLDKQRALTAQALDLARSLAGDLDITATTVVADQSAALVEASRTAALLVVGSGGLGHVGGILLGATTGKVVSHSRCPVVVVPHDAPTPDAADPATSPVLVGIDDEEHSRPAVEWAFAEAAVRSVGLTAVHAWWWGEPAPLATAAAPEDPEEWADDWQSAADAQRVMMSEMLAGCRERHPDVEVDLQFVRGETTQVLRASSRDAGLLVVGTRGRGGFTGLLLGSVSARALHQSHCPVAVVPSA